MLNKKILFFILIIMMTASISIIACTGGQTGLDLTGVSDEVYLEDEYYIGKGVNAKFLSEYPVLYNKEVVKYVNFVGATVSANTDSHVDVYKNYYFGVIDTDENVLYSSPSGYILLSKGIMKQCANEDEFAGVIAHMVGLNVGKWSIEAIPTELKKKMNYAFKGDDKDLVNEVFAEVVDTVYEYEKGGYSQEAHLSADSEAVSLLAGLGYSIEAYKSIIRKLTPSGYGYPEESVPNIEDRLNVIESASKDIESSEINPKRTERYLDILSKLE